MKAIAEKLWVGKGEASSPASTIPLPFVSSHWCLAKVTTSHLKHVVPNQHCNLHMGAFQGHMAAWKCESFLFQVQYSLGESEHDGLNKCLQTASGFELGSGTAQVLLPPSHCIRLRSDQCRSVGVTGKYWLIKELFFGIFISIGHIMPATSI